MTRRSVLPLLNVAVSAPQALLDHRSCHVSPGHADSVVILRTSGPSAALCSLRCRADASLRAFTSSPG